jgi:hypothetical protein
VRGRRFDSRWAQSFKKLLWPVTWEQLPYHLGAVAALDIMLKTAKALFSFSCSRGSMAYVGFNPSGFAASNFGLIFKQHINRAVDELLLSRCDRCLFCM